jgi:hypothetical protein
VVEADLAQGSEHGGDVTVRQRAGDGQRRLAGRDHRAALEQSAQARYPIARPVGQVEQAALPDPAAVAVALTQQDRRRRAAVRHSLDAPGRIIRPWIAQINPKNLYYMATLLGIKADICGKINSLDHAKVGSSG